MSQQLPDRHEVAAAVWVSARHFVLDNLASDDLRERLGLGRGKGRVKAMLVLKHGPLSLAELATNQNVTAPYATIIVDQLEALGFVERVTDPDDKRRKTVSLTASGREAVTLAEELEANPPSALDALTDDELTRLEELLAKVAPQASAG